MGLFDDRCQSKRGFLSTNGRAVLYLNAASSKAGRPNACDDETLRSTLNVSLQAAVASNREILLPAESSHLSWHHTAEPSLPLLSEIRVINTFKVTIITQQAAFFQTHIWFFCSWARWKRWTRQHALEYEQLTGIRLKMFMIGGSLISLWCKYYISGLKQSIMRRLSAYVISTSSASMYNQVDFGLFSQIETFFPSDDLLDWI